MGIFDNDFDLPGVYNQVESDLSYGYDTSLFGTTDSVVVVGTAFNGPSEKVVPIYSKEHASYMFGKVYDSERQIETSLVAGINDAWDRGCRTIYACRIGGKDLHKDFNLRVNRNGLSFRVASRFPTNEGKDCYFRFDNTLGDETVYIYKPADRATINEKRAGLSVSDDSVITIKLRVNQDYGLTRNSRLSDLIALVNKNAYNNVLTLSVVDKDGKNVTESDEARKLPIGVLFPGVYFIGRDANKGAEETKVDFKLVAKELKDGVLVSNAPYDKFKDLSFRTLVMNSDVTQPLPIYGSGSALKEALAPAGVVVNTRIDNETEQSHMWDWLRTLEVPDMAFVKNTENYDEADLSGFALYERLGCGFATTAMAEKRISKTGKELRPRVKETPLDSKHHTVQIPEGLYSVLQDAKVKYRAIVCAGADDSTKGKLPRADEFKVTSAESVKAFNDFLEIASNVDEDNKEDAKAFEFHFEMADETKFAHLGEIYKDNVYEVVMQVPDKEADGETAFDLHNHTVKAGTKFFEKADGGKFKLVNVASGITDYKVPAGTRFIKVEDIVTVVPAVPEVKDEQGNVTQAAVPEHKEAATEYKLMVAGADGLFEADAAVKGGKFADKNFVLGSSANNIFVYAIKGDALQPEGDLAGMCSEDQTVPVIYAEDLYFHPNQIIVESAAFDNMTLEELKDALNAHDVFGSLFSTVMTQEGSVQKDDFILAEGEDAGIVSEAQLKAVTYMPKDRTRGYNYGLYIPYKTTDNFARQLAQHCTYTELKTCPTWGFIGQHRLPSTDIATISKKVASLSEVDYDLYAKNALGRNMIDPNSGAPYPIGKNLSVTFMQYDTPITTDGYSYVSNGAAGYAGMVSQLPLDQSSTAQPIAIPEIPFNLTQYQLGKLTSKGIVTLRESFTKGITVTDGVTMAPIESVFRRLAASRVIGAVEELIRAAAEPYIGKQNCIANRDALHTAIKSRLDKIVGTLIEQYEFNLVSDPKVMKFSYIQINYSIVPVYEIREVRNTISVKDSLSN